MWMIALTVSIGILAGWFIKWTRPMRIANGKFQTVGLAVLLFLMGISIGSRPDLLNQLQWIGMKALLFSILTCALSVGIIYLGTRMMRRQTR